VLNHREDQPLSWQPASVIPLLVNSALSDSIVSIGVGGVSTMPRAGERHSCFVTVFRDRERERERERWRKKLLHRMWLSVNGNIPHEKIVGYNKNKDLGSYGKFLHRKEVNGRIY